MNSRDQLLQTLSLATSGSPPRYENEFHDDALALWRTQGFPADRTLEEYFALDHYDSDSVAWRPPGRKKCVPDTEKSFAAFRKQYDPGRHALLPRRWNRLVRQWRTREVALCISPWEEGFLQVLGIQDWDTLRRALILVCENPARVEAVMVHYAGFLEGLLDRVLQEVRPDFAFFYEPIASNHAPVVSPETYRRFVMPALRRVVACLDRHGIAHRFVWSSGRVHALIPLWLEAGINGLHITQTADSGISYLELRRLYGPSLRLLGGIDWEIVLRGPEAIDTLLDRVVRPLLEQGGYIPHLDDRIRPYIPFDNFRYYRQRLDALVAEVCSRGR